MGSYPYILDQDFAILAVVSAGCLYLVRVSMQQEEQKRVCKVSDARVAIAKSLNMQSFRLWHLSSPWVLPKIVKGDPVKVEFLGEDAEHPDIGGPRFLLLAADGPA